MFPIISVIDEVSNYDKIGDYKTLYHCKLDWTNPDNHKIKRNKEWILQFICLGLAFCILMVQIFWK
jgi:hypothetical protein